MFNDDFGFGKGDWRDINGDGKVDELEDFMDFMEFREYRNQTGGYSKMPLYKKKHSIVFSTKDKANIEIVKIILFILSSIGWIISINQSGFTVMKVITTLFLVAVISSIIKAIGDKKK